jgi:hypothetical protein
MSAKLLLLFFAILCFAGFAVSETLQELSLKEANFQGLTVEGALKEECASIAFLKEPIAEQKGIYTILSIHASFMPTSNGNAGIKVFVNNNAESLADLKPEDFENEWARVQIPITGLAEKNELKICAKTSNSIIKVQVLEDSKIGYYKMPVFEIEKTVSTTKPIVGREMQATIKAKNTGSEAGKASVKYWNVELNIAQITRGDSDFEGTIQPGETVILNYFVKPKYAVQMDLASAILEYENIFGEKKKIYSNRPTIWVQEPEFKINPTLGISSPEQKAIQPGQQASIALTARNEGLNALENVSIKIEASQGLIVSKDSFEGLNFKAGETKTFKIAVSSLEEGTKQLGCTATYTDYALVNSKCPLLALEFEKAKPNPLFGLAIVLVIIGAVIYIYIYRPERKKEQKQEK